ncbi:MAG: hypothetical protein HOL22_06320 [Euryarchaeota archaeon]|jgi:hypothetical protein|nr:hypothetical protein [Euryarchaeota archaeon]MBT5594655.1 hypothetical protein [Euryarchaeota archaeon]MBT5844221.1 hypothetical protein [Euryarchaeota archaeon]MBT6640791.1 hypothetical protein [Euryarchaeota archaeon]MBT6844197.1 hypothetical protein [Euryarchaeota archaeon]
MRRSSICKVLVTLFILGSISSAPINTEYWEDSSVNIFAVEGNNTSALGWVSPFGGDSNDFIVESLVYDDGRTVSAGWFQGSLQFRDQIDGVGATGGSEDLDFFITWMDENGSFLSAINGGSTAFDSIDAIVIMPNGDLIVAGTYCLNSVGEQCELELGDLTPLTKEDQDEDGNVFLARLDSSGSWTWATQIQNMNELFVIDMMLSDSSNIHLAVSFRNTLEFNGSFIPATNEPNLLVATFDENGQVLSHVSAESADGIEHIGALCSDGAGQNYVAITYSGLLRIADTQLYSSGSTDVAIASYSELGWNWAISGGGYGEDRAWDCDGKSTSGIHVVGEYLGNASFGALYTSQSSGVDFFIGEVSSTGGWADLVHAGGVGLERITAITHSGQGSLYVAGLTSAGLTLGNDILDDLDGINDDTHNDIFLAELLSNNTWEWAIQAGGSGNDEPMAISLGLDGSPLLSFIFSGSFEAGITTSSSLGGFDSGTWLYQTDRDNDGLLDGEDNCPRISNSDQTNLDNDLQGDACDDDDDNDNVLDDVDDCPQGEFGWFSEPGTDHDGDGCQDDGEDFDDDEDTIFDHNDLCPLGPIGWISTPEVDTEGDGCADIDTDGDGFVDQMDNCPTDANVEQLDLDDDNIGDICDIDEDGDGIANPTDNCPQDTPMWTSTTINDHDQDGCHDSITDLDDDEDGVGDADDSCPRGEVRWSSSASIDDYDGDGCRDLSEDVDDDQDGVNDVVDNCPTGLMGVAAPGQDNDGDGCIDSVEDLDDDEDGVLDSTDLCLGTIYGQQVGITGCSQYQLDDDLDGIPNAIDLCLNTVAGKIVDLAGCEIDSGNTASDDTSSNGGISMTKALYIFAALFLGAAFYFSNKPIAAPSSELPPPRPKDFPKTEEFANKATDSEQE